MGIIITIGPADPNYIQTSPFDTSEMVKWIQDPNGEAPYGLNVVAYTYTMLDEIFVNSTEEAKSFWARLRGGRHRINDVNAAAASFTRIEALAMAEEAQQYCPVLSNAIREGVRAAGRRKLWMIS